MQESRKKRYRGQYC